MNERTEFQDFKKHVPQIGKYCIQFAFCKYKKWYRH
jgi:hypothetical protein